MAYDTGVGYNSKTTSSSVGYPTTPPQSESDSKIRNGICYLEEQLETLQGSITDLTTRLETILTPNAPETNGATKNLAGATSSPSSTVHHRVQEMIDSLNIAISRVANLRMRVEL